MNLHEYQAKILLKNNNLRVLKDGQILKSTACLFFAKKKAAKLQPFLNSLN